MAYKVKMRNLFKLYSVWLLLQWRIQHGGGLVKSDDIPFLENDEFLLWLSEVFFLKNNISFIYVHEINYMA